MRNQSSEARYQVGEGEPGHQVVGGWHGALQSIFLWEMPLKKVTGLLASPWDAVGVVTETARTCVVFHLQPWIWGHLAPAPDAHYEPVPEGTWQTLTTVVLCLDGTGRQRSPGSQRRSVELNYWDLGLSDSQVRVHRGGLAQPRLQCCVGTLAVRRPLGPSCLGPRLYIPGWVMHPAGYHSTVHTTWACWCLFCPLMFPRKEIK